MAVATPKFGRPEFDGVTLELSAEESHALFNVLSPDYPKSAALSLTPLNQLRSKNPNIYGVIDALKATLSEEGALD